MSVAVGVLSVQGDVRENLLATSRAAEDLGIGADVIPTRTAQGIAELDGLIIPGGESTAIGGMSSANGSFEAMRKKILDGMPVLGICAGMIMLSSSADDRTVGRTGQPLLGVLDVGVERNAFGRQRQSFEAEVSLGPAGIPKFGGVFIRAPAVTRTGSGVETLSTLDGRIVAVQKGNIVGTAFHPELAGDAAVHRHFLGLVAARAGLA